MSFKKLFFVILGVNLSLLSFADASSISKKQSSISDVVLTDAWVRATADGQQVGAAYANLTSTNSSTLILAEADVAGSVEIHSMTMDNGVMKMRRLETLNLPKGKTVSLAPGGFHFMLFGLKKPLKEGEHTTFKLIFKAKNGKKFTQNIVMPILAQAPTQHEKKH